jgi:hypothetical protein
VRNGLARTLKKEFRTLGATIQSLDDTLQRLVSTNGAQANAADRPRRKVRLSPKARVSLVLQGRYMGHLRHLKPRQKAQIRKIREAKGVRAAIATAKVLARA